MCAILPKQLSTNLSQSVRVRYFPSHVLLFGSPLSCNAKCISFNATYGISWHGFLYCSIEHTHLNRSQSATSWQSEHIVLTFWICVFFGIRVFLCNCVYLCICPNPSTADDVKHNFCFFVFIGPESDHWQCLSVTDWLTDWLTPV